MEYNQLDPLLREVTGKGDVNDESTGFSPYPGNINQLVFALEPYWKVGCIWKAGVVGRGEGGRGGGVFLVGSDGA